MFDDFNVFDQILFDFKGDQISIELFLCVIGECYLIYVLLMIMYWVLLDVCDGLKFVYCCILYVMCELWLLFIGVFCKLVKIIGDVMGNYYLYGDGVIYDVMVCLVQFFVMCYLLVDGQGNFGNIDGDNFVVSCYIEVCLIVVFEVLMEGLVEDVVDFCLNYDGMLYEFVVLFVVFLNLLCNGVLGIVVGMVMNVLLYNLYEVIDVCLYLIKVFDVCDEMLISIMFGLDFLIGGVLVELCDIIVEVYCIGCGSLCLCVCWVVEDLGWGGWQIVVIEIFYQVQKFKLIECLVEVIQLKKVLILVDVCDEFVEDVCIVLELCVCIVDFEQLMVVLFCVLELEICFGMNMNVLIDGCQFKVCLFKELLCVFLDYCCDVLVWCSNYWLDKIVVWFEVLEGYMIVFLNFDCVIEIICYEDDFKVVMIVEFKLIDVQVEVILNMCLCVLCWFEEIELKVEYENLICECEGLVVMLVDFVV